MIVEGAYPYVVGGVSIWIQELISHLPDIDFVLWTVVPEKDQPYKFKLPQNVVQVSEIVLSEKLHSGKRRRRVHKQWKAIHDVHHQMDNGDMSGFEELYRQLSPDNPAALSPENLFRDLHGWQLITEKYNSNHPISPFVDYYWAWRATHIPMFQMMQAPIPEADLYHAVSTGYAGLLGTIAKVATTRSFILTEHGIYAKEREVEINQSDLYVGYQKRMWKKNFLGLAKIAYAHADRIFSLFQRNQRIQIQFGAPPERCEVIPNGIRVRDYESIHPRPHDGFNVGYIGRMVPIKDVKTFIMAARIILNKIPEAHFYLIGPQDEDDDYYQELLVLVETLDLQTAVTFTGKVDVKEYFPILDVLCLSSIKEAQPLSVIESLVAGVPVVATKVGDVEEILQEDGIIVPPKSPDDMAAGVVRFATDPDFRQRCIDNGRERAIRTYDLDSLIERYREIYHEHAAREVQQWQA
jgi:glycosyltransferase involved in cell wall biosynthesis